MAINFKKFFCKYFGIGCPPPPVPIPVPVPVPVPPPPTPVPTPDPTPPPISLPALSVDGKFFRSGGERWTAIETSDFALLYNILRGVDVSPVLRQRQELGFNLVRIFLTCDWMFRLHPQENPSYFATLAELPGFLARFGLYGEYVVFADATKVFPDILSQKTFYEQVLTALEPNADKCLIELVNENDQTINRIDASQFGMPRTILGSHGSNGSQAWPVQDPWRYETFHTNDAFEWQRKVGHNAMEIADAHNVPVVANENTRYPDKDSSLNHAYDAAAGAALLCAGSCFHSFHGKTSELFPEGVELDAARAWVSGAKSVDLNYQAGAYRHRFDLEGPGILRAYDRILPDGTSVAVTIRT